MERESMLLKRLHEKGFFSSVDVGIAEELLQEQFHKNESAALLICYLSLASRCGHLCIEVDGLKVNPDPIVTLTEMYQGDSVDDEDILLLQSAYEMIVEGKKHLPEKLVGLDKKQAQKPLYVFGHAIYFQRYWQYESSLLGYYRNFISQSPKIAFDQNKIEARLKDLIQNGRLLVEQAQAIRYACLYSLVLLCGGPGTGKTYTAGLLISILWESLNAAQKEKFTIALAAPTGKAAANLQKSLLSATQGCEYLQSIQAKTLHALLGIRSTTSYGEIEPLNADLVIVDESSMIDVRLMSALFQAMKPGARLILLGDGHQLPAVASGSIFADLTEYMQQGVTHLRTCLRIELKGILEVADCINQGNAEKTLECLEKQSEGIERLEMGQGASAAEKLAMYAFHHYAMSEQNLADTTHEALLNHFNRFRVLTPLRQGCFGVEEINRLIANKVKASLQMGSFFIAPIMLLKNDYRWELFNGETGILIKEMKKHEHELSLGDYALFMGKEGKIKKIPALLLPPFEYAYCLSVHKSQGSEFDHLLLLLPPGSDCFGRELFYTAVTRARKKLCIWGNDETLKAIIQKSTKRLSGIK